MKAYSIFDDFDSKAIDILKKADVKLSIHPRGMCRPNKAEMKAILEHNDCVIIGTGQKISEDMFENIITPRIIATASVGMDHITVPESKKELVTIINTPKANAQSVAEFTLSCMLYSCKRLAESAALYAQGKSNKELSKKPEDLYGKTIGVIGTGNISVRIIDFAIFFGMKVLCWTAHPERHCELQDKGVSFLTLNELVQKADIISVNLPNNEETKGLVSASLINQMHTDTIFISVSRLATINLKELLLKAEKYSSFYVCADIDLNTEIIRELPDIPNVLITPHIGGGTIETRKRMFREIAEEISKRGYI